MIPLQPFEMLGALMVAHMLCDYPLQGDFLSHAKNRTAPIAGVPWQRAMLAHSTIHGGAVWLITGYWWLGLLEMVMHWAIDDAKCASRFTFAQDQAAHIGCKALWCMMAMIADVVLGW